MLRSGLQDILRFIPPDIIFAFTFELKFLLYTFPDVLLKVGFEFTVKIKLGFNLDSKGIREAIEQEAPLKALNSFALMDTFNGVDEAMITATAGVTLTISVSAVFVKITATGGLFVEVTIDLFDAYPETSKGLFRPFELLSLGTSPLDWFEFGLRIYLVFRLSIELGIFLGPFEFVLFEWSIEFELTIYKFQYTPKKPQQPGTKDGSGNLGLSPGSSVAAGGDRLECTTLKGTTGNEEIECKYGLVYTRYPNVKSVSGVGAGDVLLRNIQSKVNLRSFTIGDLTLDYQSSGAKIIEDDTIIIQREEIQAGSFLMDFSAMSGNGNILMPEPEQPFLTTTFSNGCRSNWVLSGHSHIIVNAYEIEQNCRIVAMGGVATNAVLTIDFGYESRMPCQDGNRVLMKTNGNVNEVYITRSGWSQTATVRVGKIFNTIIIKMSICKDTVLVENTHPVKGIIDIQTGGGDDTTELGDGVSGLDGTYKPIIVDGGPGLDRLYLKDTASNRQKYVTITSGIIMGVLNGFDGNSSDISYSAIADLEMRLSNGANTLEIPATQQGTVTTVRLQDQADIIQVNETMGDLNIYAGGGPDRLYFYGLGNRTVANIYGEAGDDIIWIDGTRDFVTDPPVNTLGGSRLRWSGGNNDDKMHLKLSTLYTSDIDLFNDLDGINDVNIDCANTATVMLSRENFLANIHNASNPNSTVERINLIRENDTNTLTGFRNTASINTMVIRLNGGNNIMYFDDTFAPMDIFGGPLADGKSRDSKFVVACASVPSHGGLSVEPRFAVLVVFCEFWFVSNSRFHS